MSRSLNKCEFIGNLGKDPDIKYLPSGEPVANFSLACGEQWKDKHTGEKMEKTEWIRCVAFKKMAEIIQEYVKKGMQIYVEGKMQTREWEKDGVKRYSTEIVVESMIMLGGKGSDGAGGQARAEQQYTSASGKSSRTSQPTQFGEYFDDDIPF